MDVVDFSTGGPPPSRGLVVPPVGAVPRYIERQPLPPMSRLLELANSLDRDRFVARFGALYERSPWVAEAAWDRRPFASIDALHAAMAEAVERSARERRLALLRAHPELWGEQAQRGALTADSTAEQASAGLTTLSAAEATRIAELNAAHREKFGFPFIIAVRRHTREAIFAEFERRLALDPQAEFAECLRQVGLIARLRLDALDSA